MSRVRFVASHLLLSSSLAFPIHVGSLVDPMAGDFPLHVALFIASTVLTPTVHVFLQVSFHLVFGRPFFLLPGLSLISSLFTMCSSSLLITSLQHFSRFSVIFFGCLCYSGVIYNILISDLIFLYSTVTFQHKLVMFTGACKVSTNLYRDVWVTDGLIVTTYCVENKLPRGVTHGVVQVLTHIVTTVDGRLLAVKWFRMNHHMDSQYWLLATSTFNQRISDEMFLC